MTDVTVTESMKQDRLQLHKGVKAAVDALISGAADVSVFSVAAWGMLLSARLASRSPEFTGESTGAVLAIRGIGRRCGLFGPYAVDAVDATMLSHGCESLAQSLGSDLLSDEVLFAEITGANDDAAGMDIAS